MKNIVFSVIFVLFAGHSGAALTEDPKLNENVNNSAGGFQSSGPYTLLASAGENVIGSMGDGVHVLACGFLQAIGVFNQGDIKAKLPAERIAWAVNNKFKPEKDERVVIQFRVTDRRQRVVITIYNLFGDFVKTLADREYDPLFSNTGNPLDNFWSEPWNGRNQNNAVVGSGIYLIRVQVGDRQAILKAAVVK